MKLNNLQEAKEFVDHILQGKAVPKSLRKDPSTALTLVLKGQELGLQPVESLHDLYVTENGNIGMRGDKANALVKASGKCADMVVHESGTIEDEDYKIAISAVRSDNDERASASFSVDDAKRAGLWIDNLKLNGNPSLRYKSWYAYPKRCVKYRALGFLLRDLFPDVLKGVVITEELDDYHDPRKKTGNAKKSEKGKDVADRLLNKINK